jgi:putative acyl-CoA dehydrogenase
MALALQASVLLRAGSPVADVFCRSRLLGQHGLVFGTLPASADFAAIIGRAAPA